MSQSEPAWLLEKPSSSLILGNVRSIISAGGRSKRNSILLTLVAAILLLFTVHELSSSKPPLQQPFYCSTWDSAVAIPDQHRDAVLHDYNYWCQFNKTAAAEAESSGKSFTVPDERVARGLFSKIDENKPKNMAGSEWKKPSGFKVVAMIFYGRPHQVDILDCYLQQNMVEHGGFLDEVHFMAHTTDASALEYLDNLVAATPGYERIDVGPDCHKHPNSEECRYERLWERRVLFHGFKPSSIPSG